MYFDIRIYMCVYTPYAYIYNLCLNLELSYCNIKEWLLNSRNKVDNPLFILRHQYNFSTNPLGGKSTKHRHCS